jgi:thioredoxin-related protein
MEERMKRVVMRVLVLIVSLSSGAAASELIHFRDTTTSWDDIKSIAAKEQKFIVIDAYTDWCSWCKVMDRETFSDSVVANFVNDRFIPVEYEMETGFGATMAAKYRVNGFPTFLIFTPDGKLVYRILGYMKSKDFLEQLAAALDPGKQDHLAGISASLDPGFPDFYKQSFLKKEVRKKPDSSTVISFLEGQKDLSGEVAWSVMFRFSSLLTAPYRQYIFKNFDRLKGLYGSNDLESTASSFLSSDLSEAINANSESMLDNVIASSDKYLSEPAAEMRFSYRLRFYRGTQRWKAFADLIDSARNSNDKPDPNVINSYSWTIYEHCADKEIVVRATAWMSDAVVQNPSYMLLDTYAALLYKSGDLKKAKQYAETAIEAGKNEKQDFKETQQLLDKINASLEKKL